MKIAVDFQSASGKKTGIGVAAQNIVLGMQKLAPDIEWLLYSSGRPDLSTPQRIIWESFTIPNKARADKPDLLYSPGFAPPLHSPVPAVVTVHDLIGMAFPGNQRGAAKFYWSKWLPAAVRRARRVVASSESTRRDIERFLHIPPERVSVVPLGVDAVFRKFESPAQAEETVKRHGIQRPYFISVSTLEPRKNHMRLLEAYERMKHRKYRGSAPFMLVIVGKDGGTAAALRKFVQEKGLEQDVLFLGYVSQEDLVALYNAAIGYVMLSLYEGFGLPVLEAMSCGLTGVCSNRTSLPEVAGKTGILVDPEDLGAIENGLVELAEDEGRRKLRALAAYLRAQRFTNEDTAEQMIRIFRDELQK